MTLLPCLEQVELLFIFLQELKDLSAQDCRSWPPGLKSSKAKEGVYIVKEKHMKPTILHDVKDVVRWMYQLPVDDIGTNKGCGAIAS